MDWSRTGSQGGQDLFVCPDLNYSRRRLIEVEGLRVWFAPAEDVIVRKLQYYQEGRSEKHLQDLRGILRCSGDSLDGAWLRQIIREQGLESFWTLCQSSGGTE